jgi:hypothetical protein
MIVYAQEDLNQRVNSSTSSKSSGNSVTTKTTSTISTNSNTANLGIGFINPEFIVASLNLFMLAWTIFYMIICLSHFFNQRIFNSGGELGGEKNGMRGIYKAFRISWSYVLTLPFFVGFAFVNANYPDFALFLGVLMILVYAMKIIFDMKSFVSIFDYFPWEAKFAKTVISFLTVKK